jgi:hypothetical protein
MIRRPVPADGGSGRIRPAWHRARVRKDGLIYLTCTVWLFKGPSLYEHPLKYGPPAPALPGSLADKISCNSSHRFPQDDLMEEARRKAPHSGACLHHPPGHYPAQLKQVSCKTAGSGLSRRCVRDVAARWRRPALRDHPSSDDLGMLSDLVLLQSTPGELLLAQTPAVQSAPHLVPHTFRPSTAGPIYRTSVHGVVSDPAVFLRGEWRCPPNLPTIVVVDSVCP